MRGPLILLVTAVLVALLGFAYFGGATGVEVPEGVTDADPGAKAAARGPDPSLTDPDTVQDVPQTPDQRLNGAEEPSPSDAARASVTVRAIDATSGADIARFWVKPAGFLDMATDVPRVVKQDGAEFATLPADAWPDPSPQRFVLVSAPMFQAAEFEVPSSGTVVASLQRANGIVGTVRDGSSSPIPGVAVTVEYLGSAAQAAALSAGKVESVPFPEGFVGATLRRTDESGRFGFYGLPPGLYRTRASRDGTVQTSGPVIVSAGAWTTLDHWLDEHVRLNVTVFGPDGVPLADSRVLLTPPKDEESQGGAPDPKILASRYTGADGRATLGPLTVGQYVVLVQSDGGRAEPAPLSVTESSPSIIDLAISLSR